MIEENLKFDKGMKHFAAEIKICFSKEELEEIARKTGFVKRKVKFKHGNSFVYATGIHREC